jgi:type III pantothenate kinase
MSLVIVDIGNTRVKLGLFDAPAEHNLPTPRSTLSLPAVDWQESQLRKWLEPVPAASAWWLASVNRPAAKRLMEWLYRLRIEQSLPATAAPLPTMLSHADIPIVTAVDHPDQVGIDRLAGAAAANRLREPSRPAIIIDAGSAITVDLVTADGVFRGGAILPGIGMSARALDQFTDLLPRIPMEELNEPPPPLGTSTIAAMHSGLYWGAIGAMRELIARLSKPLDAKPEIFLTGGAGPSVASSLDPPARHVEHLVLSGIALAKV